MEELGRPDLDTYQQQPKQPVVLVLDNVRSMHNVGSAFRTADAFAVAKICLCGISAKPPHRDIHKTALGATESVAWQHYPNTQEAILALRDQGYQIGLVEQTDQSTSLAEFAPVAGQPLAFVFGHEVFGISEEVLPLADFALEIPQSGCKHSLNVSVSMGIVLWDWYSKINK